MRMIRLAESYLRQAEARIDDAEEALDKKNYPYAVRLSQECVELSLKAVLRTVGIEYPKEHDVSDLVVDFKGRFPGWFSAEAEFLQESSKILVRKREQSFYGGDEALLPHDEAFGEGDATDATSRGRRVFTLCQRLVEELKTHAGEKT